MFLFKIVKNISFPQAIYTDNYVYAMIFYSLAFCLILKIKFGFSLIWYNILLTYLMQNMSSFKPKIAFTCILFVHL